MSKLSVVAKYKFSSGHRLMNHENKCRNLHGHNYSVFIHAESETGEMDDAGRIVDFSVIKEKVGNWIKENWDHTMVLYKGDEVAIKAVEPCMTHKPTFIMNEHPTAENMARHLFDNVCSEVMKGTGAKVTKIVLWETEDCYAIAE